MSASAKAKKAARAAVAAMTPVERFSGKRKDFRLWFVRLQASMHRKGIKLDEAALAGMDDADKEELSHELVAALDDNNLTEMAMIIGDGAAMVQYLKNKYWKRDAATRADLRSKISNLKLRRPNQADEFIRKFNALVADLKCCGIDPSDEEQVQWLLSALGTGMHSAATALLTGNNLTGQQACDLIRTHARAVMLTSQSASTSEGDGPIESRKPETGSGKAGGSYNKKKFRGECHNCGKKGHRRSECRSQGGGSYDPKKRLGAGSNRDSAVSMVLTSGGGYNLAADEHLIDGGSEAHIMKSRDGIQDYEYLHDAKVAGVGKATIQGRGVIYEYVTNDTGTQVLIKREVLHVPEAPCNIYSSQVLNRVGGTEHATGDPATSYIWHPHIGRIPIMIRNTGNGRLRVISLRQQQEARTPTVVSMPATVELWHRRLVHADKRMIERLPDATVNMSIKSGEVQQEGPCEPCTMGKLKRDPLPKVGTRTFEKLEMLAIDMQGPYPEVSHQGNVYSFMAVDYATSMRWVGFCKKKSQANSLFEQLEIEWSISPANTTVRLDGAGELSKTLKSTAKRRGYRVEITCADTPQQNSKVEKAQETATNDIKCMLAESQLPRSLWQYALAYAVNVRNCTLTHGRTKTPYELFTGIKPDMRYFHVWGCVALALRSKRKRKDKLDFNAKRMIFIGKRTGTKGYLLLNPDTGREHLAHTARFLENEPGGILLPEVGAESDEEDYRESDASKQQATPNSDSAADARGRRVRKAVTQWWKVNTYTFASEGDKSNALMEACKHDPDNPTVKEALKGPKRNEWRAAIDQEIANLRQLGTFHAVNREDIPEGTKIIGTTFRLRIKRDEHGRVVRYKARLCARGDQQAEDTYLETTAPVAHPDTLHVFAAVAAEDNIMMFHMDCKSAFLNAKVDEDIFMHYPMGMHGEAGTVLKLDKSQYGIRQAANNWYHFVNDALDAEGHQALPIDTCVFRHDGLRTTTMMHVDDLNIIATSKRDVELIRHHLEKRGISIGSLEPTHFYCGIAIEQGTEGITLSQHTYINELITWTRMEDAIPRTTPCEQRKLEPNPEEGNPQRPYRQLVGRLLWLAYRTRPDICYAVQQLTRFQSNPSSAHWNAAKHIVRYLKGTAQYGLHFNKSNPLCMEAWCDSDWGGDAQDRKPTLGYVVTLRGTPISWGSRRAKSVALSSAEAEYMALCEVSRAVMFLKSLLRGMQVELDEGCVKIHTDSKGCMDMAEGLQTRNRSRHIDIQYHYSRELIQKKEIKLIKVSGEENMADIFTKPNIRAETYRKHVARIFGHAQ